MTDLSAANHFRENESWFGKKVSLKVFHVFKSFSSCCSKEKKKV